MIERFGFILARSKQSIQLFWIRTPTLDFLTNLKAIILLNIMTKGHKNFGAAGLHNFREKIKIKKKRMPENDWVLTSLLQRWLCIKWILNVCILIVDS